MSRRDPFSTPARRRRIIAEMAKKTLKFYCVAACNNVFAFREHTAAAIRLQCSIRAFVARRKVCSLRFERRRKASIKIQSLVRTKLAKLHRKRLEAALLLKRRTRLAEVVNNLRNARKQRMAWVAFLIARKLAREKKEAAAALNIQRVGRGMLARLYHKKLYKAHQALLQRRRQAAIRIQSQVRRRSAVKRCLYWSTRRKAGYIIYNNVMRWWVHRRYHRKRSSLRIQRIVRGHLGRHRFRKRWQQREEVRAHVALVLVTSTEVDVLQELILRTAQECIPQEKCMNIHVDIDMGLMQQLADKGAGHVVLWCLSNSILDYRQGHGYRAGAVVQQVVRSVDQALHTDSAHKSETAATQHQHGDEKVIALQKWDEGDAADLPEDTALPSTWSQMSFETVTGEAKQPLVGAGVSAELLSERRIELHITTITSSGSANHNDLRHTSFLRSTVTIVFNAPNIEIATSMSDSPANPLSTETASSGKRDVNELKFRFKNALVFVNNPAPPAPVTAPDPEPDEESDIEEDSSGMSRDAEEAELVAEVVEIVPEVRPRPSTAVVRIVLREPTPPPPPIDFDAKAAVIQKRARLLYRHKVRLVTGLQRSVRRMHRVAVWQDLVYTLLEVAHDAATIVQCWLRRAAAQRKLAVLRDAYDRTHYGHDFTVDEGANWAAFGLPVGVKDAFSDAAYCNPIVDVAVPDIKQLEMQHSLAAMEVRQLRQVICALQPPPAGEVLRLIGFPPPPPGCLYPNIDSAKVDTTADSPSSILMMLRLPTDAYGAGGDATLAPSSASATPLGPLSYTASMRKRAIRTWAEQCLPNTSTAQSTSMKSSASSKSPNEDLAGYRQSHLGDLHLTLAAAECTEQEPCENFVNQLVQAQLVDTVRQNTIGGAVVDTYANVAPIYKVLAAKFM